MYTTTMSKKGQIVIPAELRERFGFIVGDKIRFEVNGLGKIEVNKSMTTKERRDQLTTEIKKKGIPPLLNTRKFYQTRKPRI